MNPRLALVAVAAAVTLAARPAHAGSVDVPVVYGGPTPSEAADADARRVTATNAPARWFLSPATPVVADLYTLGSSSLTPCGAEPVAPDRFRAEAAAALESLDLVLPDEASEQFERAAGELPCLATPLAPADLAAFQFSRAIAALTRSTPDKELGFAAFTAAIAADPATPWNEDYPAFPRSVFFESKVAQLTAARARVWVLPEPGLTVLLEGSPVDGRPEGNDVLAGRHLLHLTRGDATWSGEIDLPPGGELVVGGAGAAWDALQSSPDPTRAARAYALRRAVVGGFGERVVLTRPGAYAVLDRDGTLHAWSDEGAFRSRLGVEVGGAWLYYERNIEVPAVDVPNPADQWASAQLALLWRFHPVFSAHVGGGAAWSGPFEVDGADAWRVMARANLGLAAETPRGRLRPGLFLDLAALLPGPMTVRGESKPILLLGPLAGATLSAGLTDVVWLQAYAGGGWLGSEAASAGLNVQLRFPPFRQRVVLPSEPSPALTPASSSPSQGAGPAGATLGSSVR